MRRALGYYVARGYGGSQTAALRMGGTARTAGRLYETLTREGVAPESLVDLVVGEGASAEEVIDSIVEAVRPMDGSQDAEASRLSIKDAFVELLDRFPSADLLHLSEEERFFAVERFLALDVFARFELDLGRTLQQRAPTVLVELSRRREVRDYIKETVSASLRELRAVGTQMSARRISELALQALQRTFEVFEEYVQ
ncbi:MAG: Qat anti-phage system associated protein QatB [Vicinamibacterales bacterium]